METKKCEICGARKFKFLLKKKPSNTNSKKQITFLECKNCGIIIPNPAPTNKELKDHYSKEKYVSLKKIDKNSKARKFRHILYETYFSNKTNFLKRLIFSPFKFLIRGTKITSGIKLLDIGSGSGQFMHEMREFGIEVFGIEPSNFHEEKEEKLNIKKCELKNSKYPSEFFNLITMNHVLEHIGNPQETIKEIHRIMKKEGLFIVALPNTKSLAFKIFRKNWLGLFDAGHLFNYSNKNLKFLLEKNGFKIIKKRYTSRSNQFVISLYILFDFKKRDGIIFKILEGIFLPFTWMVNFLKIGDQIEIWCTK